MPRILPLALLLTALPRPATAQNQVAGYVAPVPTAHSVFRVEPEAHAGLERLWRESVNAREERVACLIGRVEDGVPILSGVARLAPTGADSTSISAMGSIERCGPPFYVGTVHTHVTLRNGLTPYATFSGADRGIMQLWWMRWKVNGMFCVLYSGHDATCAADGIIAGGAAAHAEY
jgi:hypothetical protein